MMADIRKPIFDAARAARGGAAFSEMEVAQLDDCLNRLKVPRWNGGAPPRKLADSAAFFVAVKRLTGALDQVQVDTINGLLSGATHWPTSWVAYGLATAWHEARCKPVPEMGRGKGKKYGVPGKYGQAQYGRGLVQLTWDFNYEWADKELGLNGALLKNFDLALRPDYAARILIRGMEDGAFTTKSLADYLPNELGSFESFTRARKIINGTDKDELIADYAVKFQAALKLGGWG